MCPPDAITPSGIEHRMENTSSVVHLGVYLVVMIRDYKKEKLRACAVFRRDCVFHTSAWCTNGFGESQSNEQRRKHTHQSGPV